MNVPILKSELRLRFAHNAHAEGDRESGGDTVDHFTTELDFQVDFFNRKIRVWEPFIEKWSPVVVRILKISLFSFLFLSLTRVFQTVKLSRFLNSFEYPLCEVKVLHFALLNLLVFFRL